ncbi:GNAT family N-acetyltransferase [Sphingomonas sp. 1P06PA]|uniref:GNAT family N-acetyltransferase n=1 Tax=Sphingomonas sp. 1P06PA TaxID=554121 RepID=UPI0039A5EF87
MEHGVMQIETERLILRPHGLADFEQSFALTADPDVLRYIGVAPPTREEAWHRLLRYAGHWQLLGYGLFAVIEKASGALIGETGFADFHRGLGDRFDPFPEAAWMFAVSAHGRGYATEAAAAAHRWHDAGAARGRTVCIINPENQASLRTAAKLGYAPFGETVYRDGRVVMLDRN